MSDQNNPQIAVTLSAETQQLTQALQGLTQQHRLCSQGRAQCSGRLRLRCQRVHMHHRICIAMQVQHDVGINRQTKQLIFEVLCGGARLQRIGRVFQGTADQMRVGCGIWCQGSTQAVDHGGHQVGMAAVEVAAIAQIKAPLVLAKRLLRQANRVGKRHQHDSHLAAGRLLRAVGWAVLAGVRRNGPGDRQRAARPVAQPAAGGSSWRLVPSA